MAERTSSILLLACLMYNHDLLKLAVGKLDSYQLFDSVHDPTLAFIWRVVADVHKACPSEELNILLLRSELHARVDSAPWLGEGARADVAEIMECVTNMPREGLTHGIGRLLLEDAMVEAARVEWVERVHNIRNMADMRAHAASIAGDIAGLKARTSARVKPMYNLDNLLVSRERYGFGLKFWDELGGSFAAGEVHGLLGPTGGGKTVLAVGVACAQAMAGRHVMLVTFEQSAEGDVTERICTRLTGCPIDVFRDKRWGDLPVEVANKLVAAANTMGQYMTIVDLKREGHGFGGAEEVIDHIRQSDKDGEGPTLVILDWFGAMVDRNAAADNTVNADMRYRTLGPQFIDEFNTFCQDTGRAMLILHQLTTEAAARPPGRKPSKTDAYEMRSFSYKIDSCTCLGVLDKTYKVCWFVPDKGRRSDLPDTKLQLIGELQKFVDVNDKYELDGRNRFAPSGEIEDVEVIRKEELY